MKIPKENIFCSIRRKIIVLECDNNKKVLFTTNVNLCAIFNFRCTFTILYDSNLLCIRSITYDNSHYAKNNGCIHPLGVIFRSVRSIFFGYSMLGNPHLDIVSYK